MAELVHLANYRCIGADAVRALLAYFRGNDDQPAALCCTTKSSSGQAFGRWLVARRRWTRWEREY